MANPEDAKLQHFLHWLQLNNVELRGCNIKYSDSSKGFGVFSSKIISDNEILLVVPLDLAITPMRVLQDPLLGPECRSMFEEGEVDDRFLIILFLTVERLRKNSTWKPYLDMLPTSFGNPLWFSDDELADLKGTTLHRATVLQKKKLQSLYDAKVKELAEKVLSLDGQSNSEVRFEDFLWANSIFWTRALNIPLPRSYVFPQTLEDQDGAVPSIVGDAEALMEHLDRKNLADGEDGKRPEAHSEEGTVAAAASISQAGETVWVEGLVPGIDFCNHDLKAAATWEVDGTGSTTGVPFSMYLLSACPSLSRSEKEITISYGNKGNEELLYLYGFVMKDNPDDYLMVHYPVEAIQSIPFSESKEQLLEAQKAELRCLLPRSSLSRGFFPPCPQKREIDKSAGSMLCNYSWSGQRKTPSYLDKLVFPEDFLTALRTIAMKEDELYLVSSLLQELVDSRGESQPSDTEVRAAIWEACGDSGALQILVDLLNMKMMDLEEGSGAESRDSELLGTTSYEEILEVEKRSEANGAVQHTVMSRNRFCSIVYRQGQKELTRLFLREAEHALQLALSEEN